MVPHTVTLVVAESDASGPITLIPPTAVTACLRLPRQTDAFRIPLKKGQQVVIAVESHSLGLPLVPAVRLTDPTGAVSADASESGPEKDVLITHTAAHEGDYQLAVSDRYRRGGDRYFYRLTVWPEVADFELSLGTDAIVVTADKPADLPVTVQRRATTDGALGPITIEAVDLPQGVTAPAVVSEPTGDTAEKVALTFSTNGPAFSGPIRVRGTAEQPNGLERFARTPPKYATTTETIWLTAVAKP